MELFIDTSGQDTVRLVLVFDKKRRTHIFRTDYNLSEKLMPEMAKFLQKQKIKLSQITEIEVKKSPGSFSRMRTAVATANALIYALGLKQTLIKPVYDKAPNITFRATKMPFHAER